MENRPGGSPTFHRQAASRASGPAVPAGSSNPPTAHNPPIPFALPQPLRPRRQDRLVCLPLGQQLRRPRSLERRHRIPGRLTPPERRFPGKPQDSPPNHQAAHRVAGARPGAICSGWRFVRKENSDRKNWRQKHGKAAGTGRGCYPDDCWRFTDICGPTGPNSLARPNGLGRGCRSIPRAPTRARSVRRPSLWRPYRPRIQRFATTRPVELG